MQFAYARGEPKTFTEALRVAERESNPRFSRSAYTRAHMRLIDEGIIRKASDPLLELRPEDANTLAKFIESVHIPRLLQQFDLSTVNSSSPPSLQPHVIRTLHATGGELGLEVIEQWKHHIPDLEESLTKYNEAQQKHVYLEEKRRLLDASTGRIAKRAGGPWRHLVEAVVGILFEALGSPELDWTLHFREGSGWITGKDRRLALPYDPSAISDSDLKKWARLIDMAKQELFPQYNEYISCNIDINKLLGESLLAAKRAVVAIRNPSLIR